MPRFHQLVFIVSLVALSWFAMMAVHELGHVIAAWATGAKIERVILNPLTISRTDVLHNPNPLMVVWSGPMLGSLIPTMVSYLIPLRFNVAHKLALFFAGFCLVANGAYIAFGSFDRVGDCGIMIKHGSSMWMLWLFGATTIPTGFVLWHRLGSIKAFLSDPAGVAPATAYTLALALLATIMAQLLLSPI